MSERSSVTSAQVERMNRLFFGSDEYHGYGIDTVPGAVTAAKWEQHLKGEESIGVNPRTSRGSCIWGALTTSYSRAKITAICGKVPPSFIPCHGENGVNIFLFLDSPCSASLVTKKMLLLAEYLELEEGTFEVYPKPGGMDWMLMPYFDHDKTAMFAVIENVPQSINEFLKYAYEYRMSLADLSAISVDSLGIRRETTFKDGPPCLETMVKQGFPEFGRYEALFTVGVYLRQRHPHGWQEKLMEFNQRHIGATYTETAKIIRSMRWRSRKFQYRCMEVPMIDFCNKKICCGREYGIKPTKSDEKEMRPCVLDEVTKVVCYTPQAGSKDEPYWIFYFGDDILEVNVDMARKQAYFAREFLRQFHRVILPISDSRWMKAMNDLLESSEVHEMAFDAGLEGQFLNYVADFSETASDDMADILKGSPVVRKGRYYFRSADLIRYVFDIKRFRMFREDEIWITLVRRCNAQHHTIEVGGKGVKCWSIELTD